MLGPMASEGATGASSSERVHSARTAHLDPGFSLGRHLAITVAISAGTAAVGIALAWGGNAWAWLALPFFWVLANFFEWAIHRFPMHRPLRPRVIYTNHSLIHHRAFAGRDQDIHSLAELAIVMMPWYTLIFVLATGVPVALALGLFAGRAFAGVFLIAAVSYFLFYETIHTLHHLPQPVLDRLGIRADGWYAKLRRHHHHHHQLERMAHVNFNVTIPLADHVLGTAERPDD